MIDEIILKIQPAELKGTYRKTPFLIPGTKSRTKKSDRDLVPGINWMGS